MIQKTPQPKITAEQLGAMPGDGNVYELVNGVLKMMSPAGSEHGWIAGRIFWRLAQHVERHDLGQTYAAETGFRISDNPDTVRAPDAAFVSHVRLATVEPTRSYLPLSPDLLVEVVSPSDSFSDVESKARQWIEKGTSIVLIADPANQTICIYRDVSERIVLQSGETFDSGDVCGGWRLSVDEVFPSDND
jgi:Uma2 family endonuclease